MLPSAAPRSPTHRMVLPVFLHCEGRTCSAAASLYALCDPLNYLITSECKVWTTDHHPVHRMSPLRQLPSVGQYHTRVSAGKNSNRRFVNPKEIKIELTDCI
jgi:hypothetical protein